jgi:hypothetical protein
MREPSNDFGNSTSDVVDQVEHLGVGAVASRLMPN